MIFPPPCPAPLSSTPARESEHKDLGKAASVWGVGPARYKDSRHGRTVMGRMGTCCTTLGDHRQVEEEQEGKDGGQQLAGLWP